MRETSRNPLFETLWTENEVATYLHISPRKVEDLRAEGRMVKPLATLGLQLVFDPYEVQRWARAGCPYIDDWSV